MTINPESLAFDLAQKFQRGIDDPHGEELYKELLDVIQKHEVLSVGDMEVVNQLAYEAIERLSK